MNVPTTHTCSVLDVASNLQSCIDLLEKQSRMNDNELIIHNESTTVSVVRGRGCFLEVKNNDYPGRAFIRAVDAINYAVEQLS